MTEDGKSVSYLQVKTLKNTSFKVSAKKFIIAMGGLETPRLLLASCSVNKAGVGNEHDVVGRYYMCHMIFIIIIFCHLMVFIRDEGFR